MAHTKSEHATQLHLIAMQFRGFAAQTHWPSYRTRMLETAAEMEREAAHLEHESLEHEPVDPPAAANSRNH